MTKDEALKLALEALEAHADIGINSDKAITAIKKALAQHDSVQAKPEPEQCKYPDCKCPTENPCLKGLAQRTWQGLTDEEIDYIYTGIRAVHHDVDSDVLCRAIEAKLKEKNT